MFVKAVGDYRFDFVLFDSDATVALIVLCVCVCECCRSSLCVHKGEQEKRFVIG